MSIKIMSAVWENGPDDRSELLVMLALADFCNDEGECWPSMRSIAAKARMTERGAQKTIGRLVDAGRVSVATGGGRGGCNRYQICTRNPERNSVNVETNPEQETPNDVHRPRTDEHKPRTGVQKTPNGGSPEPSGTVKEPSVGRRGSRLPEDWSLTPEYRRAAADIGLSEFEAQRQAEIFRDYWRSKAGREASKLDWLATWRNWCRKSREFSANRNPSRSDSAAKIAAYRRMG